MTVFVSLFVLLLIGAGLCCFSRRRLEETLPLSLFSITLWLYVFGLFGQLKAGIWSLMAAAAAFAVCGVISVLRHGNIRKLPGRLFTPAVLILVLLSVVSYQSVFARESSLWDEFTHWADTVHAMFDTGRLGSDPQNNAFFPEYPPGISLFQLLAVTTASWSFGGRYVEFPVYFAYFIACAVLTMPFLKRLRFRKPLMILPAAVLVFILPLLFDHNAYSVVYIEGLMGMLIGFCMAWAFLMDSRSRMDRLTLIGGLCMLTLLKPAALLFSVIISVFAAVRFIREKRGWLHALSFPAAAAAAQLSWKLCFTLGGQHASMGSGSDFLKLFTNSYPNASSIIANFASRLSQAITLHDEFGEGNRTLLPVGLYPSLIVLFLLMIALVFLLCRASEQEHPFLLTGCAASLWIIFTVGLLLSYICIFSEIEGMKLASFDRYMEVLPSATMYLLFALATRMQPGRLAALGCAAVLLITAAFFPFSSARIYAVDHQLYRQRSWDVHSKWEAVSNALQTALTADGAEPGKTRIIAAMVDDIGAGGYAMHNIMRPWHLDYFIMTPGDPEELVEGLQGYDYLVVIALSGITEIDAENQACYGSLFEDGFMVNTLPYRITPTEDGSVKMVKIS